MKIAAIIPHLGQFGGVRRFLEIGNIFRARGQDYILHVGSKPPARLWFDYSGPIANWERIQGDVILIADPPSFKVLDRVAKGEVYIWIIAGGEYLERYKKACNGTRKVLVNNRIFLDDFKRARLCEGGVNTDKFKPGKVRTVGYYQGRGTIKGEDQIVKALSGLGSVKLVPIRGYTDYELPGIYQSLDFFVCAEIRDGWPNTAAEALACGVPVVSISRNTRPFSDRVIQVDDLRAFFESPMQEFSWERTCDRLEEIWREDGFTI